MRHKHKRFIMASKIIFLNDDDMKAYVKKMKDLVEKERGLVSAQSWRTNHEINGKVTELVAQKSKDRDLKAKDRDMKSWKQNLIKALGFPADKLVGNSDTAEPKPELTRPLAQYTDMLTANMGRWIEDLDEFKSWTKHKPDGQSFTPLLVLEGESGSGKTSMTANIHHRLLKMETPETRLSVACLFMDNTVKKGESIPVRLADVSRCLLWQCAASSEPLIKSMSAIYEEKKALDGPLDWWSRLLLDNKERERLGTTFYFLIDGLDAEIREVIPLLQSLTTKYADGSLRVCLSAKPETVEALRDIHLSFEAVKIREHNQRDIEDFITSEMDRMPILHDKGRPGVSEWRTKILKKLVENAGGDYFALTSNLDSISKLHLVEDINEVRKEFLTTVKILWSVDAPETY